MPPMRRFATQKPKDLKGTVGRILTYLKPHLGKMIVAFCCILLQVGCNIMATATLTPLLNGLSATAGADIKLTGIAELDKLALSGVVEDKIKYLVTLVIAVGCVYLTSLLVNYLLNRILITVSTSTIKRMRNELFAHMQKLPIKVFDTNTHGELMSRYTNDLDLLNDFVARCIPQVFSSALTIIGVFAAMIVLSWKLTLVMVVMLVLMALIVKFIGGKSKTNFVKQQAAVGKLNGFIEELVEGQKVVKVFNHEQKAIAEFDEINSEWQKVAGRANAYANIMGPIMNNMSHFFYAGLAVLGAIIAINSDSPLAYVGIVATFLMYIRNITMPIQQISQQINMLFMAVAGGERVFALLDTPAEVDDGYVTLVYATIAEDGTITESETRTGHWAWKHPHSDGTITYTELKGDVRFEDVTFGYDEEKTVLHNVTLYAKPGQKIAFVGSTGAGKTTITNLINRFYDVPDGKIR